MKILNELNIKKEIYKIYKDRNWDKLITDIIIKFINDYKKVFGEKYIKRIINRLGELEEIKKEYNDSKYLASSKKNYIVLFKNIENKKELQYVLEHELFHFIQKENSIFEKKPYKYKHVLDDSIRIELLEEVFVQYFTSKINNKTPEYNMINKGNKITKYWLNDCYKEIVWLGEKLENMIGIDTMMDMYMNDDIYTKEIDKYDKKYGINAFAKFIKKINYYSK